MVLAGLNDLIPSDRGTFIEKINENVRMHLAKAVAGADPGDLVGSTLDAGDQWERTAAGAAAWTKCHNVFDFVPDDRLDCVIEVRYQDLFARSTRRDRLTVAVNHFEQRPIRLLMRSVPLG